jgi:DNA-binding HxlR family transcriptional regulator
VVSAHLQQLLQHRWDPLIIIALQDGAARFTQLAQHVSTTAGTRVADGVLTKALRRLQDQDLVVRLPDVGNTFAYNLTGVGYAVAPATRAVVQAIAAAANSGIC